MFLKFGGDFGFRPRGGGVWGGIRGGFLSDFLVGWALRIQNTYIEILAKPKYEC
jgi:hypothetical protein